MLNFWKRRWKDYDPSWLIDLALEQHPDKPWLPKSLLECTRASRKNDYYIYFISSHRANQKGSEWQFKEYITLVDPIQGELILDVLEGDRIGGIEFYSALFTT